MKKNKRALRIALCIFCVLQLGLSGCAQTGAAPSTHESTAPAAEPSNSVSSNYEDEDEYIEDVEEDCEEDEELPDSDDSSEMPNVTGKTIGEAVDIIENLGLEYTIEYEYVKNVELHKVISQTPNEGTPLSSDTAVTLIVSGEKKKDESNNSSKSKDEKKAESKAVHDESTVSEQAVPVETTQKMPNIVGMDSAEAMNTLTSMGIYYTGTYQFDSNTPKGQVISQEPAAGSSAPKGSKVTFIISDGPQPEQQTITYEVTQTEGTGNAVQTTEPAAGATPAEDYLGRWYSFRPYAQITKRDNGQYFVEIRWTSSATTAIEWIMFADYNPSNGTLTYTDGKELMSYYDTTRKEWRRHYPTQYYLSGYFMINGSGELLWFDSDVPKSGEIAFYHD